jgi:O-antigen ligase
MAMKSLGFRSLLNFRTLALVAPVFLLTYKHWINVMVVLSCIGAASYLIKTRRTPTLMTTTIQTWRKWLAWTLVGPFVAVALGQLLRQEFFPPNFDTPLRLLLCIPVFMAISRGWLTKRNERPISEIWVCTVFPITLLWTLVDRSAYTTDWGPESVTTYFFDPLSFGSICLLLALMSFAGLSFYWRKMSALQQAVSIFGILAGFYLSVMSGSRTGWANLPVFLAVWTIFFSSKYIGLKKSSAIVLLTLSLAIAAIISNPVIAHKMGLAWQEIQNYKWSGMNEDHSVTMRISFYRMALHYFMQRPFSGWGDTGWLVHMNDPALLVYASEYTRDFARNGFHNEILTSTVRSGVWGLASSIALFLMPVAWASHQMHKDKVGNTSRKNLLVIFFILHLLIAGMTTEVTNLVTLSSFFGFFWAVLVGDSIQNATVHPR